MNSIAELTKLPLDMLDSWNEATAASDMSTQVAPLAAKIDEAVRAAEASVEQLQRAVDKLAKAPSAEGVHAALTRLNAAVA